MWNYFKWNLTLLSFFFFTLGLYNYYMIIKAVIIYLSLNGKYIQYIQQELCP